MVNIEIDKRKLFNMEHFHKHTLQIVLSSPIPWYQKSFLEEFSGIRLESHTHSTYPSLLITFFMRMQ